MLQKLLKRWKCRSAMSRLNAKRIYVLKQMNMYLENGDEENFQIWRQALEIYSAAWTKEFETYKSL